MKNCPQKSANTRSSGNLKIFKASSFSQIILVANKLYQVIP